MLFLDDNKTEKVVNVFEEWTDRQLRGRSTGYNVRFCLQVWSSVQILAILGLLIAIIAIIGAH